MLRIFVLIKNIIFKSMVFKSNKNVFIFKNFKIIMLILLCCIYFFFNKVNFKENFFLVRWN